MANLEEAREVWGNVKGGFQEATPTRIAYMGDGRGFATSNMVVAAKPSLIYCRESPDDPNFFVIQNRAVQPAFNKQVILGYLPHEPEIEQVIDFVTESVMYKQGGSAVGQTIAHRQQHQFGGGDEVFIDPRLFIPGLGRPTEPPSASVYVTPFSYYYNEWNRFGGGNSIDITRYNPVSGSRYVLVSLDPAANELTYTLGNEYTIESSEFSDIGITEGAGGWGFVPPPAANEYPLFAVALTPNTTTVNWQEDVLDNLIEARLHITPPFKFVLDRIQSLEGSLGISNELTTIGAETSATAEYIANAGLLRGTNISETAPTNGQVLSYQQAQNSWAPSYLPGHFNNVYSASAWNDLTIPVWQAPIDSGITFSQIDATAIGNVAGASLTFTLEKKNFAEMGTGGTSVFSSNQTATLGGLQSTAFNGNASIMIPEQHLVFVTGSGAATGGTIDFVSITGYYTHTGASPA